jgi:hypothetical protein
MSSLLLVAALILWTPALQAQNARPMQAQNARPILIADARTGCQVWNPYPQPDESIAWSGRCVNGLATGSGVMELSKGGKVIVRYEGRYRKGNRNGQGVSTWHDGARYEGNYREGLPNGKGKLTSAKGEVFVGMWVNGCLKLRNRWAFAHTTQEDCGFVATAPTSR